MATPRSLLADTCIGWNYHERCCSIMAFEGCFFFKDQCLCTGWNSSGTAFGIDVMQYIYVDEDRRDFNSQVDKMILSSGITVPVLFFYLQKMKSDSGFT